MNIARGIKSLFLTEFVSAFFLTMKYFFAPKKTLNYPFEKVHSLPGFAGSTRSGVIRMGKSAVSPANFARRSARPRRSP